VVHLQIAAYTRRADELRLGRAIAMADMGGHGHSFGPWVASEAGTVPPEVAPWAAGVIIRSTSPPTRSGGGGAQKCVARGADGTGVVGRSKVELG